MSTFDSDFRIKHGLQVAGNSVVNGDSTVVGNTILQGTSNQVGTVTSGTWNATAIDRQYGGFGQDTTGLSGYVFFDGAVTTASPTIPASVLTGSLSSSATVAWSRITSTPTTLSGYGITDAASSSALTSHTSDGSLHLTAAQNTLLDGLSDSLTSTEVNRLVGVTAPIQTQIDARLPLAGGTMTGNITMSSGSTITGLPNPTTSAQAANKAYVDALAATSTTFAGDATGSGLVGSTINLTLTNSGVTAGTYRSVTVNAKGLVTAGTNPTTLAGYGITDAQPLDADLTSIAGITATTGLLRKTAANTWSLDTNSYITGNQTITLSGDATGTGTTSISLTLANSGVTAGTYRSVTVDAKGRVTDGTNPTTLSGYGITDAVSANTAITAGTATKITYDAKGLVTAGTTLVAADIPNLDTAKITTGTFAAARMPAFAGDATSTAGTTTLTLANSGVTAGSYGSSTNIPQIAVDAKGRITSASNVAVSIPSGSLTFTGDVTGTGSTGSSTTLTLANSGVTAGTYSSVTVDVKGRVTAGTNPTTLSGYGITDAVNKAGDTMTGLLTLSGPPTANNHAATKQYVETEISRSIPVGAIGQVPFISVDGTRTSVQDYTLKTGQFIENDSELALAQTRITTPLEIFNTWSRFSHNNTTNQPANASELNGWSYNSTTQRIQSTINSETYIGFVSPSRYANYVHEVVLRSTDGDDDTIGVLLAWYVDPTTGREFTLSALRSPGGNGFTWRVVFNQSRSDAWVVSDGTAQIKWGNGAYGATAAAAGYTANPTLGGWDDFPNGTRVRITRSGDTIVCETSDLNTSTYVPAATLTINLTSDARLERFRGPSAIGYTALSQAAANFEVLQFTDPASAIYDVRNGNTYQYVNGVWVLQPGSTNLFNQIGVGRLLYDIYTTKLYYVDTPTSVLRLNVAGSSSIGGDTGMTSTSTTVASTTPTVIGSFAVTAYGSAKVVVQAKRGTIRHTTELLVVHDGTTAYATEYGTVQTGASLYTINVDVSGGNVRILATGTSATSTVYKTFLTLIKD